MNQPPAGEFRIKSETDIVSARRIVRDVATALRFGATDVTRIVTAASELSRNIYAYARSGTMSWRPVSRGTDVGLALTFTDNGPGIADVDEVMQPGFSTSHGLGMGLPGSKRLMDEMTVVSELGHGTSVEVRKWVRRWA